MTLAVTYEIDDLPKVDEWLAVEVGVPFTVDAWVKTLPFVEIWCEGKFWSGTGDALMVGKKFLIRPPFSYLNLHICDQNR